jgi:hypothetical protein
VKYPEFELTFRCERDLDAVCALLSQHLFLGLPFVESDAYQEIPSRQLQRELFGLWVVVAGGDGEFWIDMKPVFNLSWGEHNLFGFARHRADAFPEYAFHLLARVPGITPISWHPPGEPKES